MFFTLPCYKQAFSKEMELSGLRLECHDQTPSPPQCGLLALCEASRRRSISTAKHLDGEATRRRSTSTRSDGEAMTVKRIRGRALQRMRAQVLNENPLCVSCEKLGRVTVASEVDHLQALINGGADSVLNMQGLCPACHVDKTRKDLGQKPRAVFDENGRVKW